MTVGRATLAAVLVLLAACVSIPFGLEPLDVGLADLSYLGGSLFEQRFEVSLRVTNPNRRKLTIEGLNFTMDVNGRQFARGVSDRAFEIPALGDTVVTLPVTSSLDQLLRQLRAPGSLTGIDYQISGQLLLGGFGAVPFSRSGRIGSPEPEHPPQRGKF